MRTCSRLFRELAKNPAILTARDSELVHRARWTLSCTPQAFGGDSERTYLVRNISRYCFSRDRRDRRARTVAVAKFSSAGTTAAGDITGARHRAGQPASERRAPRHGCRMSAGGAFGSGRHEWQRGTRAGAFDAFSGARRGGQAGRGKRECETGSRKRRPGSSGDGGQCVELGAADLPADRQRSGTDAPCRQESGAHRYDRGSEQPVAARRLGTQQFVGSEWTTAASGRGQSRRLDLHAIAVKL